MQIVSFLDSLPIPVLLYGPDLNCIAANARASMFLYAHGPVDHVLQSLSPLEDPNRWTRYAKRALANSRPLVIQPLASGVQGKPTLRVTLSPIADELDRAPSSVLVTFEQIDYYQGRMPADRHLAEPLYMDLIHQINGALDGAIRNLYLAARYADRPYQGQGYLEACRQSLERIAMLVRQALKTLAAGPSSTALPVAAIIDQALSAVQLHWSGGHIRVTKQIAEGLPPVRCRGLLQVLCNLFKNAFDAMADGGVLEVRAGLVQGKDLQISIHDSGPGVDPRLLDRVFEPFFTTKAAGTGLGLGICKDIVERYEGTIRLENSPQGGAVVTVLLPLTQIS